MINPTPAPETIRKLSSLESKMEYVIKTIDNIHDHVEKTNGRVSTLEIWRGWMTGGMVVIALFFGIVVGYLIK